MIYVCSLEIDNSFLLEGKEVLTSLSQLYRVIWDKETREVELLDDFVNEYFTPSSMVNFIDEAKKVNPYLKVKMQRDYNVYYDSMAKDLRRLNSLDDIVSYFMMNNKEAVRLLHHICDNYQSQYEEALLANNKLSTLYLEIAELKRKLQVAEKKEAVKDSLYLEARTKLDTLVSRINYNYNKNLSEDSLLGIDVGLSKYRRILYIKEITRVHYVDTLIYYLQEILKTLYGVPARLIVIEAAYAYERSKLYPTCKRHTDLTYRDVINSNIYMAGFHSNLMDSILKNPSDAYYLIVLDRSGADKPYLRGQNVEGIMTVSDMKDLGEGVLPRNRIISYQKNTLYIPFIEGFNNMSMEQKIGKYSSMESMKEIIKLLEGGSDYNAGQ